jgi:putative transposase
MPRGYLKTATTVYLMNYHFAWCPKYRRKILAGKLAERLEQLIREKAQQLECRIIQLRVMPDNVYLFIEGNPKLSPNRIIGEIKGYTSRVLRREFTELLKMPTLWTRSYFVSTAGNVSSQVIEQYIEAQKGT